MLKAAPRPNQTRTTGSATGRGGGLLWSKRALFFLVSLLTILGMLMALAANLAQPAYAAPARRPSSQQEEIDGYVQTIMQDLRIPGLALAVVKGDQVLYLRGYGQADASGSPVTPQTSFILGSTSKSFTALAVMQLVEAGKISLDVPVRSYLPWFDMQDGVAGPGAAAKITVRQLLNHTSGITTYTGNASMAENDPRPDALEAQVRSFKNAALGYVPGTTFEYSNANYQVAGLIVETVSGQPFGERVEQKLFAPLEMRHSHTSLAAARQDGLAAGHVYWFGFPAEAAYLPFSTANVPSADMISTAEDLSHYLVAQLNGGAYQGRAIITPTGLEITHQAGSRNYAMGWFNERDYDFHNGVVPDYGSQLLISRDRQYGIAVLFNANQNLSQPVFYQLGPGILQILQGVRPNIASDQKDYRASLVTFAVLIGIEILGIAANIALMKRLQNRKKHLGRPGVVVGCLVFGLDLALAAFFLSRLEAGLAGTLIFQPDLFVLILIFCAGLVGWGLARTAWVIRLARPMPI